MNLVTIFDYPENTKIGHTFLRIWLNQVNLYAKGFNVYVIHGDDGISPSNREFIATHCKDINVVLVHGQKNPKKYGIRQLDENFHVNFNGYNSLTFGQSLGQPIIYLDLDAFLFSDLKEWWDIVTDRPFMGLEHYPLCRNLNAGVYSVSDWDFMTFDKLVDRFYENLEKYEEIIRMSEVKRKDGWYELDYTTPYSVYTETGVLRSGDQSLFINYFIGTDNHPYYEKLSSGWNFYGWHCDITKVENEWKIEKFTRRWHSIDKVRVVHYYAQSKKKLYASDFYKEVGNNGKC